MWLPAFIGHIPSTCLCSRPLSMKRLGGTQGQWNLCRWRKVLEDDRYFPLPLSPTPVLRDPFSKIANRRHTQKKQLTHCYMDHQPSAKNRPRSLASLCPVKQFPTDASQLAAFFLLWCWRLNPQLYARLASVLPIISSVPPAVKLLITALLILWRVKINYMLYLHRPNLCSVFMLWF